MPSIDVIRMLNWKLSSGTVQAHLLTYAQTQSISTCNVYSLFRIRLNILVTTITPFFFKCIVHMHLNVLKRWCDDHSLCAYLAAQSSQYDGDIDFQASKKYRESYVTVIYERDSFHVVPGQFFTLLVLDYPLKLYQQQSHKAIRFVFLAADVAYGTI